MIQPAQIHQNFIETRLVFGEGWCVSHSAMHIEYSRFLRVKNANNTDKAALYRRIRERPGVTSKYVSGREYFFGVGICPRERLYSNIPGIDKPVSRLVLGTMWMNTGNLDATFAALDAFHDAGGNCFDTAHGYGGGDSERAVGQWIHSRNVRDEVVILGKGAHHSRDRKRVTPFDIQSDLHDSLARFQVDHIDLYLLHRDDPSKPVGPIVETLNAEKEAGRIHAFGGSNWSVERLQEANDYAAAHGLTPFVASSPQFSLAVQQVPPWIDCISLSGPAGEAARAWCRQNSVTLFVWSSLAGGFFSGRFRRDNLDTLTEPYDQLAIKVYCCEENFQRQDRAQELAACKGVTVPHIALAYVYNQPEGIHALSGARTPDEVRVNVEATEIELTAAEIAYLDLKR